LIAPWADPPAPSDLVYSLAAVVALLVAVVGSMAAVSLLVYSPTKLARMLKSNGESQILTHLREHGDEYQVLGRFLGLGGLVGGSVLLWAGQPGSLPLAFAVYALLAVVFCGVLPAYLSKSHAERIALATTRLLRPCLALAHYPLIVPLKTIAASMLRILRVPDGRPATPDEIAEEITAAVSDSANNQELPEEERSWIENIVELSHRHASEVMTPRTDVLAFNRSMPLLEAVRLASHAGFSRFPVYEDKVDNVVGVFYAKDALPLVGNGRDEVDSSVSDKMRKPLFVPESMNLIELLRQFRASKVQMAIVLDEYGGTAGVVTIEDVLEEIVGDITDEYDADESEPIRVVEEGRVIEITGRARVDEANEILGTHIPEDGDYDTVAGLVFSTLDRIPKINETVPVNGVEIRILRADERRIRRMRLTVLDE
jgi:putative hemolysin